MRRSVDAAMLARRPRRSLALRYDPPMLPRRHALCATLAVLLALRAFVPVGYMLALPGGGAPGGLALCPLQNPGLDLAALGTALHEPAHHHHGAPGQPLDPAGAQLPGEQSLPAYGAAGDCALWVASSGPAPVHSAAARPGDAPAAPALPAVHTAARLPAPRGHALTRAPPRQA